ncbi:MAG TPA: DUF420 domain-containing protein [Polyangiaceae bacterium]|nr:DUF420 domain-containing protein [Polyangiaceae bacterium]
MKLSVALISLLVFAVIALLLRKAPEAHPAVQPGLLAQLNAALNAASALCMTVGFLHIKKGDEQGHKRWMIAAFSFSCLFLVGYVLHHLQVGSVPFSGHGWLRTLYFALLIPHVVLAAVALPLVLLTLLRGLAGKRRLHHRVASYTLPIWFYVSVSGVIVYFMLYHL